MANSGITDWDLIALDIESNQMIKEHRASLGLETPENRVDVADIKIVLNALSKLGFIVLKQSVLRELMMKIAPR